MMRFSDLMKAVASIPHIGQILAATITIAVGIYEEVQNLESRFQAEKELGEEAHHIMRDILLYSRNLIASDLVHMQRLAKESRKLEEVVRDIQKHAIDSACARQRHERKFGTTFADFYDAVIETSSVLTLERRLKEAKTKFMEEYNWIRVFEGHTVGIGPPPYLLDDKQDSPPEVNQFGPVRWVNKKELDTTPDIKQKMVSVCHKRASEDGELWYIARVPFFGAYLPGKYKPGDGAHFGYGGESFEAGDRNYDVLVAEPGSVSWVHMSGVFSEERLCPYRSVEGCRDSDFSELAIARAWAREHMKIGILTGTPLTVQPGKAGPRLECAYVIAGKEEKKIENYEVLVYALGERS